MKQSERLLVAMEDNFYAHIAYVARQQPQLEIIDNPYLLSISNGFVGRANFGAAPDAIRGAVNLVKRYFGKSPFSWFITPSSTPADLAVHLLDSGFQLAKAEPGLGLFLPARSAPPRRSPLLLQRVVNAAQLATFERLYRQIWETDCPYSAAAPHLLQADCPLQLHLGQQHDETPFVCATFVQPDAVGLYALGTVPALRRRGFARAGLTALLETLRRQGQRAVVLQATPTAQALYRQAGFQELCSYYEYRFRSFD